MPSLILRWEIFPFQPVFGRYLLSSSTIEKLDSQGYRLLEATCAFTLVTAWILAHHPFDGFVDRLQQFSFLPHCYPSYRALVFTLVGYSPTEHFLPFLDIPVLCSAGFHQALFFCILDPTPFLRSSTALPCSTIVQLPHCYRLSYIDKSLPLRIGFIY